MYTRDLKVTINMDEVLHRIDCHKDSELYDEIVEEYREMEAEMYALCEPVFLLEYDKIGPELSVEGVPSGTPVLMALCSIGGKLGQYSTAAFSKGDYVKGMLADAVADSALVSLKKEILPYLKEACGQLRMGIRRRLEAPNDIPIRAQKVVWEKTKAQERCGINISSGYMLDPVKSHAEIYVLSPDEELFFHQHNCRKCNRMDCSGRNIPDLPIKVYNGTKVFTLQVKEGQSLLHALMEANHSFTAVCGGRGSCGKCKIKVLEGYLPITSSDEACLSKEEIEKGMRLSCKAYPEEPLTIEIAFQGEENFQVLTETTEKVNRVEENTKSGKSSGKTKPDSVFEKETCGIAIDIGTTTIAVQLLSLTSGKKLATHTTINHQRMYGADVISRITASVQGKKDELQKLIRKDLSEGIRKIVAKAGVKTQQIAEVAIAGNTTMVHLLMGYDCKGLGEYPFTPVNIKLIKDTYINIVGDDFLEADVYVLPGISTFVGGDIVAGLYTCDFDTSADYNLLIDLGTNGELALGNKEKILVTSTAAGPAFEGGNIAFGVGSIEGAISGVHIDEQGAYIQTIADKAPIGICGTGVIETVSELVKTNLVDETGCLDETYFDEGYPLAVKEDGTQIVFTQSDIREIQLAKAAVRAGVETLFLRYGISMEAVSHVYLAGGFGFKLDCKKAIEIGMLPKSFAGKVEPIGNSSLSGAVKFLTEKETRERVAFIGADSQEINLSADKDFNQLYMDAMYFEKK